MRCMSRNFGAKSLVDIVGNSGSAWRCVFCNPAPLKSFIQDYKQAYQLQRIAILEEEEDSSDKEVSIKQRARYIPFQGSASCRYVNYHIRMKFGGVIKAQLPYGVIHSKTKCLLL